MFAVMSFVENNDMGEELDKMKSTPNTTKTNATPSSLPSVTRSVAGEAIEDTDGQGKPPKKPKTCTSEVWNYFDKIGLIDGVEKCRCKGCRGLYTCKSSSGTAHLKQHAQKCNSLIHYQDVSVMLDNKATLLRQYKLDQMAYQDALAAAIILHDLPLNYAEYEGVWAVNRVLNPEFKPTSRGTTTSDCMKRYYIRKEKLKCVLTNIRGRICLTSDVWTSINTQGYMIVTAHYVDEDWVLNNKLLAFCHLDSSHTAFRTSYLYTMLCWEDCEFVISKMDLTE